MPWLQAIEETIKQFLGNPIWKFILILYIVCTNINIHVCKISQYPHTHTHREREGKRERPSHSYTHVHTQREKDTFRSALMSHLWRDNLDIFFPSGRLIFQNCTRPLLLQLFWSVTPKAVVTYVRVWSWATTSWRNTMDRHFQHAILAAELCVLYTRNNITFVVTMFYNIIFYTLTFTLFIPYHN